MNIVFQNDWILIIMQAFEGTFATLIQKVRAYINVGATQT